MNIEKAIDILTQKENIDLSNHFNNTRFFEAIYTLLTAYEKEKGENVKLRLQDIPLIEGELKAYKDRVNELKQELEKEKEERERIGKLYYEANENCIKYEKMIKKEKEKNKELKWKPIKDYDRKKYDWVLVKYFDGDYECVPEVAERRNDGKWYTSERQIPFEVKYFFDMQEILEG